LDGWRVAVQTWDSIRARRNVREFEDRSISPENLERILDAAWAHTFLHEPTTWDSVGQAKMNMMLAAANLGFGALTGRAMLKRSPRGILSLPGDRFCVGISTRRLLP
jgi:nitroreductase